MQTQNDEQGKQDRVVDLIAAIANGDAERGDVAAILRREGIDALDLLVAALSSAAQSQRMVKATARIDLQRPSDDSKEAETGPRSSSHQVPSMPFLLRGTLYDPQDIARFDGQELHSIAAPGRDYLLAIDDRRLMDDWWRLTQMSAVAFSAPDKVLGSRPGESHPTGDSGDVGPTNFGGPVLILPPPPPGSGSGPFIHTNFYEDINYDGDRLPLQAGHEIGRLSEWSHGFLGTSDWNDTISSVQLVWTVSATLFEHTFFQGSSITITGGAPNLLALGWNDRASSLRTF